MIVPCKCGYHAHISCLNKLRLKDKEAYEKCPNCGAEYNLEPKEYKQWVANLQITIGVLRDFIIFTMIFILASFGLGWVITKLGGGFSFTHNPVLVGSLVICTILGIVALFFVFIKQPSNCFYMTDFQGQDGLMVLIVVGALCLIGGSIFFVVKTTTDRIEHHKRRVEILHTNIHDFSVTEGERLL